METIAIVGVGLIGGSFALAMRKTGFDGRITGVSSQRSVDAALERNIIDEGLPLEEAVAGADLVYLAQPIQQILKTLRVIGPHVKQGALVTDAGSTKRAICIQAGKSIQNAKFVGGHPMAGKESRGVEHADANLFTDRPYILCTRDDHFEEWLHKIGVRLVLMSPARHDRLVALASHLPQMLSTALGCVLAQDPDTSQIAGPGALDMTRLAMSSYDIWQDIMATNGDSIEAALEKAIAQLEELRTMVRGPEMSEKFRVAGEAAKSLRKG